MRPYDSLTIDGVLTVASGGKLTVSDKLTIKGEALISGEVETKDFTFEQGATLTFTNEQASGGFLLCVFHWQAKKLYFPVDLTYTTTPPLRLRLKYAKEVFFL